MNGPDFDELEQKMLNQLIREIKGRDSYHETWEPLEARPTITKPTYQTRPAFQAPDFFIVQYIGGAFNGAQEYLNYATHKLCIVEGGVYEKALPSPSPTISPEGIVSAAAILHARYSLTFIPRDQTPFAESAQVVIALFKE